MSHVTLHFPLAEYHRRIAKTRKAMEAKGLGVFSDEQRTRLKDPERDFHLERTGEGQWALQSYDKFHFEHAKRTRQPGEPASSEWTFENAFGPQTLHLHLLLTGEGAEAKDLTIEIDRFFTVAVPAVLKKGRSLVWDGSDTMTLYDEKGRKTGTVEVGKSLPLLQKGTHTISVDAQWTGGDLPVLKGIVKLAGAVETVGR